VRRAPCNPERVEIGIVQIFGMSKELESDFITSFTWFRNRDLLFFSDMRGMLDASTDNTREIKRKSKSRFQRIKSKLNLRVFFSLSYLIIYSLRYEFLLSLDVFRVDALSS